MYDEYMDDGIMDFFSMFNGDPQMVMRQAELDRLYKSDILKYSQKLVETKHAGYRVFRNSQGKHLLKEKV